MSLPNTFGLQSKYNDKYLCYIDNQDSQLHGFLQFSVDNFPTPHSIFKTEPANTADDFINIRSVYSNKYWVSRYENEEHWIVAEADEPNEDQSSSSCTLFQAIPVDDIGAIRLRLLHVHLKKYVSLSKDSPQFPFCIFAGSVDPDPDGFDVFVVKNLPKQLRQSLVAFKGDNEKYLKVEVIDGKPHLRFSAKGTKEEEVWFECPNNAMRNNITVPIKSKSNNEFWKCENKWVYAEADTPKPNDSTTSFHFQWLDDSPKNKVALRVGDFYCQRYADEGKSNMMDCLIANASKITQQAKLHVEERKVNKPPRGMD